MVSNHGAQPEACFYFEQVKCQGGNSIRAGQGEHIAQNPISALLV